MGTRFQLQDTPLVIGRDEACDICLPEPSVSRRHATIQPDGATYCVRDLHSTNGTYVNDERVSIGWLRDGDYLHVGNCICRFLAGGNVEAHYHEELHRLTIIDALTDVYNRRYLLDFLERELAAAVRYRRPLALLLFDVDHFKQVNDSLGHLGGDFTLRELGACLKKVARGSDVLARYGGEEFALVMPDTDGVAALQAGERLRQAVAAHPFRYEGHSYPVTISVGVAVCQGGEGLTPCEIIARADRHLLRAKQLGRNRVEGWAA